MAKAEAYIPEEEDNKLKLIRQPRAITSTDIQIYKPDFRASMHTELQKFGKPGSQPLLGEDIENTVKTYGLNFSETEDKALHAIQKLLDRSNYQGNEPGEQIQSASFKFSGYLPTLSMTYSEYFEAYGLRPARDGRYHGAQAQEALKGLKSLANSRYMSYRRLKGYNKEGKPLYDVIRATRPLIEILEGFESLEEEEASQVEAGLELPEKRNTRIAIQASPILVDQIDTFFLLKPSGLHAEIQALHPGKRYPRAISLFIEWLLTIDKPSMHPGKRTLAEILRLDSLIKERKWALIDKRIQEALSVAKELGYLLDYEETATGLLNMRLNPERCRRIESKRRRGRKAKKEAE